MSCRSASRLQCTRASRHWPGSRMRCRSPRLYVTAGRPPAVPLAAGRGPRGGAIAVSRGLLAAAPPAELEGVLAHELAHIRNRDVARADGRSRSWRPRLIETSRVGGFLQRALLFHLGRSPRPSPPADLAEAGVRRRPRGGPLLRLAGIVWPMRSQARASGGARAFRASPATEPLYTTNPFLEEGLAALFVTHPPVGERVRRLRELDPDWREKLRAASTKEEGRLAGPSKEINRRRPTLPGGCPPSTIGASGLNFSVRNGKRCNPDAITAEIVKSAH